MVSFIENETVDISSFFNLLFLLLLLSKSLNIYYEEYMINFGDLDERIFLNDLSDSEYFNYNAENLFNYAGNSMDRIVSSAFIKV